MQLSKLLSNYLWWLQEAEVCAQVHTQAQNVEINKTLLNHFQ